MSRDELRALLASVASGKLGVEAASEALVKLPFEDLGFAKVDHHRTLRSGLPEAVWGRDKTAAHIAEIMARYGEAEQLCIVTGVDPDKAEAVLDLLPRAHRKAARYESLPRLLVLGDPEPFRGRGPIAVVAAGTSDLPVAEEAARTAELLGMKVERVVDVGVSGIHRILSERERMEACEVVIVVAGMEGALPAVVKGMLSRPVIAVPTSVGVGAAMNGLTAMMGMLTACAPGMTVVNVDNGFGAGYTATIIALDREAAGLE